MCNPCGGAWSVKLTKLNRCLALLQVVTLIVWCAGRFFLYTSYYAIFGALFGVQNFGKMVAIDNTVNGLVGLLQLPLTQWGLHGLNGNFTAINIIQVPSLVHIHVHMRNGTPCCSA